MAQALSGGARIGIPGIVMQLVEKTNTETDCQKSAEVNPDQFMCISKQFRDGKKKKHPEGFKLCLSEGSQTKKKKKIIITYSINPFMCL